MDTVLQTHNLTKKFGNKVVVDHLNLTVNRGDIYGFIGANGAGKTTTMKLILDLLFPSEGEIELFGEKPTRETLKKVGSLIEAPGLYKKSSAYENMKRFAILTGSSDSEIQDLLELVGLSNVGKKKAGKFSLGMRQRLGIAIAMLGNPELLVLDEPINGLDPVGIKEVRDIILKINKERNVSFIISSHLLSELSKVATTYGIISDGKLVDEMSEAELEEKCSENLHIKCDNQERAVQIIKDKFEVEEISMHDNDIILKINASESARINEALVMEKIMVSELSMNNNSFEDYFVERIGK